ncbi:MAG: hypothetical protein JSV75_01550, partial [Candidatus Bathyarchaeota archaeon]
MNKVEDSIDHRRIRRAVWIVLTISILFGYVLQSVAGSAYYSMMMQANGTVTSPPVILQNGTAGISSIYTNSTSAKVRATGYPYDFVDNDVANVDSSSDRGTHSNFSAQQYGPDSTYDTLTEENTKGIEDYVDQLSDEDSSADRGSHSNFENQKNRDSSYDTLTEATAVGGNWGDDTPQGTSTTVTNCRLMGGMSPNIDDLTLKNVSIYISGSGSIRLAVYQGGSLASGPAGATLVYDFGTVTPSGVGWVTATGANVSLAKNETTWIGWKGNDGTVNVFYDTSWDSASDFQSGNGRFDSSGESIDETDGWDSTFPSGGSYSTYWYSAYLTYEVPTNYRLDLEAQFTNVTDFLPTEKLCIYAGNIGSEDVEVDYWNGTGWENVATALTANSWNNYTVSLTSTTFTVRFKDGTPSGDTTQNQWQIDASLLRVGGAGSKEDAVDNDTSDVDSSADLGDLANFDNMNATDSTYANLTESTPGGITYINSAEASATSGTSAQVNKPTGTAEDDFMIALLVSTIGSDTDGSTMSSAPSGWTSEHNYTQTATYGQHVYVYWKVGGASEPPSYTWTWTSSCGWVAQITTFRNVDTVSPIHVEGTVNQDSSSSPMSPSVTTTEDNCMIWL